MMKELTSGNTIESLFWELIKDQRGLYNGGLRLLATLLKSEKTPFMKQYIKHCKYYTLHTFLTLRFQALRDPSLDLSRILSPDCIAASKVKFSEFEDRYIHFLETRGISPITSSYFKPSQWSIDNFNLFVRKASFLDTKIDWNSWCGDVEISGEHFSSALWDSNYRLWRLLNYKCVKKMTESKRIMTRSRFPTIFKSKNGDTPRHSFMKIITLAATQLALKESDQQFPQQLTVIKENVNLILKKLINDYKRDESMTLLPWTAAKIVKDCGIPLDDMNWVDHAPKRIFSVTYQILKEFYLVNSNWLLNLIYISVNDQQSVSFDSAVNKLINWLFDLEPTIPNICQLLEIIGSKSFKLKESIFSRLDENQLTQVNRECSSHCDSLIIPLKNRIETVLNRKRQFLNQIMKLDIPVSVKNQFWEILRILLRYESMILIGNSAKFEKGFGSASFRSFDRLLEHFLELFLKNPSLYIRTGTGSNGKPIIIPYLTLPDRVLRLLFSIIARSIILDFKVPFQIHFEFFIAAFYISGRDQLRKILKIKRIFYSNSRLIDNSHVAEFDRINRNDENVDLLADHIMKLCTQEPTFVKISYPTFTRLLQSQLRACHGGLYRIIPIDATFTAKEMYSLIFKR